MQYSNLVFIAVIIGVFYFLVIRPQQKRQRAQQDMISALGPGDEIVTIGGIYGTVVSTGERIRIAVADGTELEVAKQAVGQRLTTAPSGDGDEEAAGTEEALEAPGETDDETASSETHELA